MTILAAVVLIASMSNLPQIAVRYPRADELEVRIDRRLAFRARMVGGKAISATQWRDERASMTQERAEPMFLGYPHGPKTADWAPTGLLKSTYSFKFVAGESADLEIPGDQESFACSDRSGASISATFGGASAGAFNAVYDRSTDRLMAIDGAVKLQRVGGRWHALVTGPATVDVKPDYYRNHLGYFLWDRARPLWSRPVGGWCSWAAYGQDVNETEVAAAAEFFSSQLKEFGYDVIQIDDGYQRVLQLTEEHQPITEPFSHYWTIPNSKFPSGMKAMATKISGLGMTPGIWVGLYLPLGLKHADGYVTGPDGKPLAGPWVGYSMDSGDRAAVDEAYLDTLRTFRAEGWRYFKIDTLRHVLYDSYRRVPEYWAAHHTDSSAAYRRLFAQVREAVGKENYLLACWGTLPELAGLPDGCRIGEDVGPSFTSMRKAAKYIAQFHYANNVIWRDDPDYMCLRVPLAECQTWATLTSLTGGHVMVSDPISTYDSGRVDILRRVGPPAMVKPGNVAPLPPDPEWVTLHAADGDQRWTVVQRIAWNALPASTKPLAALGLDPDQKYVAFDFWKRRFLGLVERSANFDALEQGASQTVCFRPATGKPQLLGDDRHISQGAVELRNVKFGDGKLSGEFHQTAAAAWKLYVYVPEGWSFDSATLTSRRLEPRVLELTAPPGSGWLKWSASFKK